MRLTAEHITYHYLGSKRNILSDVNISVEHTERVGIMAASGIGKTTLCQILAGYRTSGEGKVLLDGTPLPQRGYCPVQMIWQHPEMAVNPRVKLREVLREGSHVEGRILRGLGIEEDWCGRYPSELSGGELQRFCIARALGEGTRFLIADEISTMLDLITQSQIWNFLLGELRERDIGLIMTSHDPQLMDMVCTRKIDLEKTAECFDQL